MEVTHESRRENLVPQDVESASRSEMSSGSWRLSVREFPALSESRGGDHQHGFFTLSSFLHAPRKRRKVSDYYKKQERLLEGFTEIETMTENGGMPGSLTEDEMQQLAKSERMAIYLSNIANIVLFAAKLYVSIQSRSLAVIASTLDSLLDLLSGFILWFTSHAMRNPNQYRYPIGKNRMQPVGIIVFASVMATLGLQILLESGRQFMAKTQPERDPEKEKWMIGIMVCVTIVKFMLVVYCRRFKNDIIRAYAQDHFFDVITNSIGLAAAILAIRFYWWIDPTGAVMIALYTMNTWTKIVIENVWALIGRTAPPEFLAKLTYLIWNHHEDIKHIDTVRAYTFGSNYFVEVDIVLPQDMLLNKAHDIGESLQEKLEQLPEIERAFVHIDFEYSHRPEHKIGV
ncbi:metal tolerance protein 10-like [Quercus lobata]|uniref:Cation efflux protein cytoplasmic domain-containing protein n=1 Tax=Quercus lobata TaxID=97700 RepID=A0A7N2LLA5_QUELO|nr:metal tolerance protein 10-like [Quercus lobata]XP_030962206.1 metal tolerance protein 10-like [Quercus lobata]XP_030962207.1 metal tolerance protein 10-like [Quercus lobata]